MEFKAVEIRGRKYGYADSHNQDTIYTPIKKNNNNNNDNNDNINNNYRNIYSNNSSPISNNNNYNKYKKVDKVNFIDDEFMTTVSHGL